MHIALTAGMGTLCIAIASFVVLAQPAASLGINTTHPVIYRGQVLQGDSSQTCSSETQRMRVRNWVNIAVQRFLQKSVPPPVVDQLVGDM